MRRRWLYLIVALACFAFAAMQIDGLTTARREARLNSRAALSGVPPMYALADGVLGGFRGFLISGLWQRAAEKKAAGQFYEMLDLYRLIATLEPNYPNAWANMAWDLSYNLAAEFNDEPAARVYWFFAGVNLLRNQALRHNPRAQLLYEELSWLLFNKAVDSLDPAFPLYRRYLATEMTAILGDNYELRAPLSPEAQAMLADKLNMDAEVMRALNEKFAPLDWRLPAAQSLYWAWRGQRELLASDPHADALRYLRLIYFSLIQLAHQGTGIIISDGTVIGIPQPRLVNAIIAYMENLLADVRYNPVNFGVQTSLQHFLETTLLNYYFNDEFANAEVMRQKLFALTGDEKIKRGTLSEYVKTQLPEFIGGLNDAEAIMLLTSFVQRAYRYLMIGDPQKYREQMAWFATNYAQLAHDYARRFHATFAERQTTGMPTATELCAIFAARLLRNHTDYSEAERAKFRAGLQQYAPQILAAAEKIAAMDVE